MDELSNLPRELIDQIISRLSAKEAMSLKYASKKWMNLVTIIPSIVFAVNRESFQDFAYRLSLAKRAFHRVRRFSLKLDSLEFAQYNIVNECLRNVLKCGVLDLELDINVKGDYSLPDVIFTCKSVVNLKLGSGFVIDILPKNALLPSLKTLLLDSVRFVSVNGCAFQKLLSACPVIEELVIDGFNCEKWDWYRTVYSPVLKRLTIRREFSYEYEVADYDAISFDTPSLVYLEYSDVLQHEFPVVNLDSLVEAKLDLTMMAVRFKSDVKHLIKGLKNVHILRLDWVDTAMVLECYSGAVAPVFENMSHLFMPTEPEVCWDAVKFFVNRSPNLKTLTIEDLHYTDDLHDDPKSVCECLEGYSFLMSCPIKILEITRFKGQIGEMVQIKHVLENLQFLVLLEVHVKARRYDQKLRDDEKLQIVEDLLMLPRASSKCKFEIKFS